ncbi:MAG: ABC transporter substrate-binding protein [Bacteroidales bacterium]|nr:ABC transporter substrate-binding protein [Bacteroidales bacterium]MCM1146484.1 ABC transporter substrate-binding protein [Bacteroidales bacterium]MCM1205078.1 ABC transporter substrate-binding protein [Bacillota bacterium]MCM1509324.1 ABC transporter substrate-binding protein [Clostridium sp.]
MFSKKFYIVTLAAVLALLTSCAGSGTASRIGGAENVSMKYARLLTMQEREGFILAEIKNPWDTAKILHRYILVPKGHENDLPENIPEGDIVGIPLSHSVFSGSVHVSLIDRLGAYNSVSGVCDLQFMNLSKIHTDAGKGKLRDCGSSLNPDIEAIIDTSPDAILLSPFENSGSYGKLGKLGIPLIECADYMETSPLGCAEWMKFYGILFGKQAEADSLFTSMEKDYNQLKALVKGKKSPTVFTEKKYGSAWYVAGANSTIGQMLSDAGAEYIFKDEQSSGARPYAPEVVFDRAQKAQIWLIKYNQEKPLSYSDLSKEWSNYTKMSAFKNRNIFACNLGETMYYEETPFHPNLLLRDYIKIFHPELLKDYQLRYYRCLE